MKRSKLFILIGVVAVVVILVVVFMVFGLPGGTVQLPVGEWVLVQDGQSSIYVKCDYCIRKAGGELEVGFTSIGELRANDSDRLSTDPKYAIASGLVGDTAILGRRTTHYDAYERPSNVTSVQFLRFKIVSFDVSADMATIRVLPKSDE